MSADARTLLRDSPMSPFQIMVVVLCTLLNMIDGFDVLAISFTAPVIAKEWGVAPVALGVLFSAGLAGMCTGSLFLSPFADVWGRRAIVNLCVIVISAGMFASAIASNVWDLALYRFLTGLGVGGMLSSGNTLLAEYSSVRWRNLSISAMVAGYPIGAVIGGSIAAYVIVAFGWRSAFLLGGAASAVLLPLCFFFLPESIDHILTARPANALARINRVMRSLGQPPLTALPERAREDDAARTVLGVFEPRFLKGTILICTSFFMLMLTFYFLLNWIPKNMVDLGFSVQNGIFSSVLINLGGAIGGFAFGYAADRSSARQLAPYLFVLLFASIIVLASLSASLTLLFAASFVFGFFLIGCMASLYAIVPLIYPPQVRNTGTGLAIGVGRMGAVIGPYLGGLLIAAGWQRLTYYAVLALPVLVTAALVRRIPLMGESAGGADPAQGRQSLRPAE
jgi:benzoate transport